MIIDMILSEGFEISAMEMFYLNRPAIEEFYDVYKGVLPEYVPLIEHFISGPSIVLEIRQENVVRAFRELVGPHDPEIAKYLRPNTIRAKFGLDRVRNAVHCTDLEEDATLEVRIFYGFYQTGYSVNTSLTYCKHTNEKEIALSFIFIFAFFKKRFC